MAAGLVGCVSVSKTNPFSASEIDSRSPIATEAKQASQAPGDYPRFAAIPPAPGDLRPTSAWKTAVLSDLSLKRSTEARASQIPFTLSNNDGWAEGQRSKIPAREMIAPAPDTAAQTEAYAAAQRARATPPSSPN